MKIYWGLRPSPKKVRERIATLERELGIDDASVLAEVEASRLQRTRPRGPVLLEKSAQPSDPGTLSMRPGFKWPVFEPSDVQFLHTSAASSVAIAPKSSVVLPAGVRV